jgi:hypothetical protein
MKARKSAKRVHIINKVISIFSHPSIFEVVNRYSWSEERIQTYMYKELSEGMLEIFRDIYPNYQETTILRKADNSINWSGHRGKTIHNLSVLGVLHRPDFEVEVDGTKMAVEVKKGEDGSSVREGIGQSLFYSAGYHFVIYVLVDSTQDFQIRESIERLPEKAIIDGLWNNFNIRLQVV